MTKPGDVPWVSILLVCHNDGRWLRRCLESIRDQTIADQIEVIIADNNSEDGSDRLAKSLVTDLPRARFLSTGGDKGFCAGTNAAASVARGKYLFVLNPDTWLEPDCLRHLYKATEAANTSVAGPTIFNYDDSSLQSECPVGFDFSGNLMLPKAGHTAPRPFSAGGFIFIRRELFQKLGGLDEQFFMYCEEQDLAWRVWLSGEAIISVPAARVHHQGAVGVKGIPGGVALQNRTSAQKRFLANRNRLLVILKNCQNILLLMLLPCVGILAIEALVILLMTRSWVLAKDSCVAPIIDLWRLRRTIGERRRCIAAMRRRGDIWMLRFFRLGFGRWYEIRKILANGFPRFG